jgi:hypothetical protein
MATIAWNIYWKCKISRPVSKCSKYKLLYISVHFGMDEAYFGTVTAEKYFSRIIIFPSLHMKFTKFALSSITNYDTEKSCKWLYSLLSQTSNLLQTLWYDSKCRISSWMTEDTKTKERTVTWIIVILNSNTKRKLLF